MAKTYTFRFTIQDAEFSAHFVTVKYGPGHTKVEEIKEMTFADAQHYLREFSFSHGGPHCAFCSMRYTNDRKPPGYAKWHNRIDKPA